jgi:uncharacterized FlaG/YvyC family protein
MSDNMASNLGKLSRSGQDAAAQTARSQPGVEQGVQPKGKSPVRSESRADSKTDKARAQDVNLKFMVDADTKNVTILVVDRSSKEVVRTIPPEEMSRLDPGELLQLFA